MSPRAQTRAMRTRLTVWALLLVMSVQVFAGTLAWCLQGDEPARLEAALAPCDHAAPASHDDCPDHDDHLMIDVAQASASTASAANDFAVAPALVWYLPRSVTDLPIMQHRATLDRYRRFYEEPPRIADAHVGVSTRLLV
jgi:hypothetical protein